ncbi:hypothetical protein MUK42_07782 [Musa troglodytarum]|uniref:Uncharacterized protein n=1 Tax=Musa troglodytarum TaxID=320322 RepID=A0A9E7FJZ5_9LILI|nr:hypothetical protein MUK42_07782 [Musa troglodytarum]
MQKRGRRELDGAFIAKRFCVSRMATGGAQQSRRLQSGSRERDPELSLLRKRADTAPPRRGRYPRKAAVDNARNCAWGTRRWRCDSEMACREFSVQLVTQGVTRTDAYTEPEGNPKVAHAKRHRRLKSPMRPICCQMKQRTLDFVSFGCHHVHTLGLGTPD